MDPIDAERARSGPYGGPIAHGYLTLSLLIPLWGQLVELRGIGMTINYGLNKLRFPAPVPVGSKVRVGATLAGLEDIAGGAQGTLDLVLEVEGKDKPSCVAQAVFRYYT